MRKRFSFSLIAGIVLTGLIVLLSLISVFYTPYDGEAMDLMNRFSLPSAEHLLGTDHFGRDILSRLMDACRRALSGGLFSVTLGSLLGIMLGLAASLSGRKTRELLMRFTDALAAFPTILMALMLAAALGRGLLPSVAAICIYMIPSFSRLTLSMADEARSRLYIKAAVSYNVPARRLILFHLLPPLLSRLLTQFTSSIGSAVLGADDHAAGFQSSRRRHKQYVRRPPCLIISSQLTIFMLKTQAPQSLRECHCA